VAPETCHVLVGPSGSGKTLFLEALAGFRRVTQGTIRCEGRDITHADPEQRTLGYVPQDLALFPHMTVAEQVRYALRWNPHLRATAPPHIATLEDRLGLTALRDRRPDTLSGGERQRVALARALASGARWLLLDEPFSALHATLRWELRRLLQELQHEFHLGLLLVTHDLDEAFTLGDAVSIVMEGRLLQSGPRDAVRRHPATVRVAQFLGIPNLFEGRILEREATRARIHCPGFPRDLWISSQRLPEGPEDRVMLGIAPEDVRFVRAGVDRPDPWNTFPAHVLFERAHAALHTVLVRPHDGSITLEVTLPTRTWQRLTQGTPGALSIALAPDHLFGMPWEHPTSQSDS